MKERTAHGEAGCLVGLLGMAMRLRKKSVIQMCLQKTKSLLRKLYLLVGSLQVYFFVHCVALE